MMVLESLACGTPVAAFDMGVARDVLFDGKTGYVARIKDAADLATGIERILSGNVSDWLRMGEACRELAVARFAPRTQARAFSQLFDFLLRERKSSDP